MKEIVMEVAGAPAEKEFEQMIGERRPILMRGAGEAATALMSWGTEGLQEKMRGRAVTVMLEDPDAPYGMSPVGDLEWSEAVKMVRDRPAWAGPAYLAQIPLSPEDLGMALEEMVPPFARAAFSGGTPKSVNLWFGTGGTLTMTHFDWRDNLYAQISGTKRWMVAHPNESRKLWSPGPEGFFGQPDGHLSMRDPWTSDGGDADWDEFTIGGGDLLFLPAGWWHTVRSETVSSSINLWGSSGIAGFGVPQAMAELARKEFDREAVRRLERELVCASPQDLMARVTAAGLWRAALALAVVVQPEAVAKFGRETVDMALASLARLDPCGEKTEAVFRTVAEILMTSGL